MPELIPIFHASVKNEDHVLTLHWLPSEQRLLRSYLTPLVGAMLDVTIRKHRRQRTPKSNRYYWGVVVTLLAEHCGYERDEMHELLAFRFLRIKDDPITGSPRRRRTPETDTKEFGEYVDACIRLAGELGVVIPSPDRVSVYD